jgi:hypothetical protein
VAFPSRNCFPATERLPIDQTARPGASPSGKKHWAVTILYGDIDNRQARPADHGDRLPGSARGGDPHPTYDYDADEGLRIAEGGVSGMRREARADGNGG